MIYFDNASTTQAFAEARMAVEDASERLFFNPSALYSPALRVREALDDVRAVVAGQLFADRREIVFTSGATEANNWVFASGYKSKKGNIVLSMGEHASVYDCASALRAKGADIRFVPLLPDGRTDIDGLARTLDADTCLVSIIHCSNETGAINDLATIAPIVRRRAPAALFHSDGVQAFCKISTDLRKLGVDLYTVSSHKICGPKGCGALFINKKCRLSPFILGGGQEGGQRSGTENTPAIIGFGRAVSIFNKKHDVDKIFKIFSFLKDALVGDGWVYNGAESYSGYILSLSYSGIKAEVLQHMLEQQDILIGLGSACASKTSGNRVLASMGKNKWLVEGNIRLSFCADTTISDAEIVLAKIRESLNVLKVKMKII